MKKSGRVFKITTSIFEIQWVKTHFNSSYPSTHLNSSQTRFFQVEPGPTHVNSGFFCQIMRDIATYYQLGGFTDSGEAFR
jgi:hypothetical protein